MQSSPFVRSPLVLLALAWCAATAACRAAEGPTVVVDTPGGEVVVSVELALTPAARQHGLMFRDQLGEYEGMLFVFPQAEERWFWMKNTPLPLDIIYIDDHRRIVSIAERTEPYSTQPVPSNGRARYVLEVNGGFARRHGLHSGQKVELPAVRAAEVR